MYMNFYIMYAEVGYGGTKEQGTHLFKFQLDDNGCVDMYTRRLCCDDRNGQEDKLIDSGESTRVYTKADYYKDGQTIKYYQKVTVIPHGHNSEQFKQCEQGDKTIITLDATAT